MAGARKGKKSGKVGARAREATGERAERDKREGKGSACSNPIVNFIPPPTPGCQMISEAIISNKNLVEFSQEKNARTSR